MPPERDTDTLAVVAGAVFVVSGMAFLAHQLDAFQLEARWIGPILLIVVGLTVLLASRPGRR